MDGTKGVNGEDASAATKVGVSKDLPLSPVAGCSSALDVTSVEDTGQRDGTDGMKENKNQLV